MWELLCHRTVHPPGELAAAASVRADNASWQQSGTGSVAEKVHPGLVLSWQETGHSGQDGLT